MPAPGAQFTEALRDLAALAARVADTLGPQLDVALGLVEDTVRGGGTLFFCGNGGSAADAQHLATEYVVRYMRNRRAYPAIALTTDTSLLTAAGNDLGFESVFARQVEALARPGDLLLCFSTSGNSPNIVAALRAARARGAGSITLLGNDGGAARGLADLEVVVSSADTARIQEAHLQILHFICEVVEAAILGAEDEAVQIYHQATKPPSH
jgi:D-sedoheptulose 7-phosphate isomerase